MKAYVYIVQCEGSWHAKMTIEPAVDKVFWFSGYFGSEGYLYNGLASSGWLWREALPLGDACRLVELWNEGSSTSRTGGQYKELTRLFACVEKALKEGREGVGKDNARWWLRWRKERKYDESSEESGLLEKVKRWDQRGGHLDKEMRDDEQISEMNEMEYSKGESGRREQGTEKHRRLNDAFSDAELGEIAAGAELAADLLQGRALLRSEVYALLEGATEPSAEAGWRGALQLASLLGRLRLSGSVAAGNGARADALGRRRRERICLRCGSGEALLQRTSCAACGRECAYCTACIGMGRSRECELLVRGQRMGLARGAATVRSSLGEAGKTLTVEQRLVKWKLSPAQAAAAAKALVFVERDVAKGKAVFKAAEQKEEAVRDFLLWAVTGAGKTEMIFPLVESVLLRGGKALIATPRRDVVIELDPRIRKAFPEASVVTLYGGSQQRWESGNITLSTTHQLLRFYQGFDLVIVDEIDAFPYHGDPILHYAADKSCAPGASRLLLSATPPSELQRAARKGKLPHARVPVRYHRHPLPVPRLLQTLTVQQMLQQKRVSPVLLSALKKSLERDAQLFVFVQKIVQTEPMAALLQTALRHPYIAATSSQDAERSEKVQRFRAREIRVLVTTTILERGVTIPKSDVYILDADGRLFDEASLVQMAGRAGRSADDPFGNVYFCSKERNQSQVAAVRHIQTMNRMARKHGYLLPSNKGGRAR